MTEFILLDAFKTKSFIIDLPLCKVMLENTEFPWLFLIPRRPNIRQMNHLNKADRDLLMEEITVASNIIEELFPTDVLNVAAIGNKTAQLHIHVISRNKDDELWPEVVWGQNTKMISNDKLAARINMIQNAFAKITS